MVVAYQRAETSLPVYVYVKLVRANLVDERQTVIDMHTCGRRIVARRVVKIEHIDQQESPEFRVTITCT